MKMIFDGRVSIIRDPARMLLVDWSCQYSPATRPPRNLFLKSTNDRRGEFVKSAALCTKDPSRIITPPRNNTSLPKRHLATLNSRARKAYEPRGIDRRYVAANGLSGTASQHNCSQHKTQQQASHTNLESDYLHAMVGVLSSLAKARRPFWRAPFSDCGMQETLTL